MRRVEGRVGATSHLHEPAYRCGNVAHSFATSAQPSQVLVLLEACWQANTSFSLQSTSAFARLPQSQKDGLVLGRHTLGGHTLSPDSVSVRNGTSLRDRMR